MSHPSENPWFVCHTQRPNAVWRLIAIPHGGGGPQAFRTWDESLPDNVELLTIHLPGRGSRLAEPPVDDMDTLTDTLVDALHTCFDKPFALVGHSVGALIAYAVTRRLAERGLPLPLHVFASAHHAPTDLALERQRAQSMHDLPETELVAVVDGLGLLPPGTLDDPELRALVLPPMRADFALSETFVLSGGDPALPCPLTALGGTDDDLVSPDDLQRWADCTNTHFEVAIFEGDHFYTTTHVEELTRLIEEQTAASITALPDSILLGDRTDYPRDALLHELFRDQAARTPEAIALVDGDTRLTYADLDAQTDLLARHLQARGVVVDSFVGIYLDTSADFVLAYLAALKAGGAYMPIDLAYPPAMLTEVLEEAGPVAIVTAPQHVESLPRSWQETTIVLDEDWQERAESEGVAVLDEGRELPGPNSLAYCVMSSGTTGRPKVIACPHRGAVCSYSWRFRHLPYERDEREACNVFFVWEVLRPMLAGQTAYVIPDDVIFDPLRLADYLHDHEITRVLFTPSLLDQILGTPGLDLQRAFASVRVVYLNGEVVPTALAQRAARLLPHVRFVNDYSISECHDVTTLDLATLDAELSPKYAPVGDAMDDVRIYLLDNEQRTVKRGFVGEVYVGGDTLARGYHGRPDLTAERFVPDPIREDGSLLFRTGDAGRILHDGRLELHGRIAFMVKLRGYSIVPGAVESVIRSFDPVAAVAVTTLDDPETGQPEHLVAHVVFEAHSGSAEPGPAEALVTELRTHLKAHLPYYCVPSFIVPMAALPLAATGKLDRSALPDPRTARRERRPGPQSSGDVSTGRSARETRGAVARAYRDVLGIDEVGPDDNFFDLGGHSLAAAELCARLRSDHGLETSVIDVFEHPTVRLLAASFGGHGDARGSDPARRRTVEPDDSTAGPIAVVGVACRFPGAPDADTFWENVRDGVRSIRELSDAELAERGVPADLYNDPNYRKVGAIVDDVADFEPRFWGISRKEAVLMDPQQRLFLECAWEALESAGQAPKQGGERTGVFGGVFLPTYLLHHLHGGGLMDPRDPMEAHLTEIGNDKDYVTTRVSHLLDLRGPSVAVQTSCSTSLVAVAQACESLQAGHCDTALAGASSLTFPQAGYLYAEGHINSEDGHCRPFDADASGTILGDGVGVVVLKRLADAQAAGDTVLAVISGFATNNDGGLKAGYSAPSAAGQSEVVAAAHEMAGADPDTFSYLECHGTGTLVGDPIEVRGLTTVFRRGTDRTGYCAIGSVKGGIGHSNIAAGMAGLIKTVLALHHRQIPPLVDYRTPNPGLELETSPFYVNTELRDWPAFDGHPRRAGVSSFGIGGTNAHLVLEEAPVDTRAPSSMSGTNVLPLSARTPGSLEQAAENLASALERRPDADLADVCWTLASGRERFVHRLAVAANDVPSAAEALRRAAVPAEPTVRVTEDRTGVVFAFPGQGSQYAAMGAGLYEDVPEFRAAYDECAAILAEDHDIDLPGIAFAQPGEEVTRAAGLERAYHAQPALFAMEYALARTLMAWGITPTALVGHSLGEYVAATIAGVISLRDALTLVQTRAWAMEEAGEGWMLAAKCDAERAARLVADEAAVEVAVVNSSGDCVLSGEPEAVARVVARFEAEGVGTQRLHTTRAFHSPMMNDAAARVAEAARGVSLREPRIPLVSNLTGTWMTREEALAPGYWGAHLRGQVRFDLNATALLDTDPALIFEVGPGRTLSSLFTSVVAARGASAEPPAVVQLGRHPLQAGVTDAHVLAEGVGRAWAAGLEPDWGAVATSNDPDRDLRRVPLPGYAFDRERCWPDDVQASALGASVAAASEAADVMLPPERWTWLPSWRRTLAPALLPEASAYPDERPDDSPSRAWLVLLDERGLSAEVGRRVVDRLRAAGDLVTVAVRSEGDGRLDPGADRVALAPTAEALETLLRDLTDQDRRPDRIVSLWPLDDAAQEVELPQVHRELAHLATALTRVGGSEPLRVWVASRDTVQVDDEHVDPLRATLLGPALVLAQENPHITCHVVDLDLGNSDGHDDKVDVTAVAETLLRECSPDRLDEAFLVAWRGDRRWVPSYEEVTVPTGASRLRRGGVYVITGGLGRIGRVLTRHLVGLGAEVVVTTRGEGGRSEDGSSVLQCDPALEGDLDRVLRETVERHGRVDGIFHAAGLADLTYLGDLDDNLMRRELSPKVAGLLRLDEAVGQLEERGEAPEFVVLFSSIAGTLGGLAMSAYMAANRVMDTWAEANPRRHGTDWVCVAWDDWDFDYGKEQTAAYTETGADRFAMSAEQGLQTLDRILAIGGPVHLLVSTRPLQPRLDQWVDQPAVAQADEPAHGESDVADDDAVDLTGRMVGVYEKVLGVRGIAPDDDFFALGGDSLLAAQILAQLRASLGLAGEIQLQDVFTHPTVSRLAAHLEDAMP